MNFQTQLSKILNCNTDMKILNKNDNDRHGFEIT